MSMYPYRYSALGSDWQYFEAKDARSALKIVCKKKYKPNQIKLQTTIDGTTDEWVNCSHLQDDRNYAPVVGPDGNRYDSMTDASIHAGHSIASISRWAANGLRGWSLAEVSLAAVS